MKDDDQIFHQFQSSDMLEMSFDLPVQSCTEIIRELHLQRFVGILEGGKLAEEISHLSASASLLHIKKLLLFLVLKFLPFPPWQ